MRRRRHRKANELARLLVALERLAAAEGRRPPRRVARLSVGAAR